MPSHKMLAFLALRRHGLDEIEHHGLLLQNRRQQLRVLILLDFKLSPLHALKLWHLFVRMSSLLGQFAFELELQALESALSVLCDLSFFSLLHYTCSCHVTDVRHRRLMLLCHGQWWRCVTSFLT
ncbi:hypothetical protein PsorP6_011821 [Peronosclerospora sorghi]|uniref:Uncharacterized protein n=1 Tax=Peronosclerospora sorghi TaxID=230839 RepID=A0ACC0WJF3_9STRA|nr:hypothetical protein PsorP6_011821 [Peronosclerospora sorghi]